MKSGYITINVEISFKYKELCLNIYAIDLKNGIADANQRNYM